MLSTHFIGAFTGRLKSKAINFYGVWANQKFTGRLTVCGHDTENEFSDWYVERTLEEILDEKIFLGSAAPNYNFECKFELDIEESNEAREMLEYLDSIVPENTRIANKVASYFQKQREMQEESNSSIQINPPIL